jgi:hypothetical protein
MTRRLLLLIGVLAVAARAGAQEIAVPDAPETKTVKGYAIVSILIEREPFWRLVIVYRDDLKNEGRDEHTGESYYLDPATGTKTFRPDGASELIKQFNTMNFSTQSMNRRVLQHLSQHGKIPPSTVVGAPESPANQVLDDRTPTPKPLTPPKVKK